MKILRGVSFPISKFPFRFSVWWHYIVPPILGIVLCLLDKHYTFFSFFTILQFLITLICTAAFGYFINDWADIEADSVSGKANAVAKILLWQRPIILIFLLSTAFLPWLWLKNAPYGILGFYLWLIEIMALCLYSIPPFRLKNRGVWGVFCDMLYGHILPVGIAVAIFCGTTLPPKIWLMVGFCLLFLKGMRNIIVHQIQDRVADRKSKTHTFVLLIGGAQSARMVNKILLPFEVLLNLCIGLMLYDTEPIWLQSLLLFLVWTFIVFDMPFYRYTFRYDRFWYFLNDYYEGWFPYISFFLMVIHQSLSLLWLCVWVIAFNMPLLKLIKEIQNAYNETQKLWVRVIHKSKKIFTK